MIIEIVLMSLSKLQEKGARGNSKTERERYPSKTKRGRRITKKTRKRRKTSPRKGKTRNTKRKIKARRRKEARVGRFRKKKIGSRRGKEARIGHYRKEKIGPGGRNKKTKGRNIYSLCLGTRFPGAMGSTIGSQGSHGAHRLP